MTVWAGWHVLESIPPRSSIQTRLRVSGIRDGVVFLPFHHGYWDDPDTGPRAANERPITGWDSLSKQPIDKTAVAAVRLLDRDGQPSQAPTNTASAPRVAERREYRLPPAVLPPSPSRSSRERGTEPGGSPLLRNVHRGEAELERELHAVGERHATFHDPARHGRLAPLVPGDRKALVGRYGHELTDDQDPQASSPPAAASREMAAGLLGVSAQILTSPERATQSAAVYGGIDLSAQQTNQADRWPSVEAFSSTAHRSGPKTS